MSTEVQNASANAVAALQSLKGGLANVKQNIRTTSGDPFLRLLSDGGWVYGSEDTEIEEGSLWAVNPMSLQHGYVSWTDHPKEAKKKNEIVGERMVPMTAELPDINKLPETDWPWAHQLSFQLACVSGEDTGEQVLYKTTSIGGKNAVNELIGEIMKHLDVDPATPVPVIQLLSDSYRHKTYGKTYFPVFEIEKWVAMDATTLEGAKPAETPPAATPKPEPAPRRRTAAAEQPVQEPDDSAATGEADPFDQTVVAAHAPATDGGRRRRRPQG